MVKHRKVLLVEPYFPIPSKSTKDFLPIGLLKIGAFLRATGVEVKLIRGFPRRKPQEMREFVPDEVWVTSLFTYWAEYVKDAVNYCRAIFPGAKILVGGIYASLFPAEEVKEFIGCDEVYQGVFQESECFPPAYDLLGKESEFIDYQILHTSRGCPRHCPYCGTWQIEPNFTYKTSIRNEVTHKKLIFYDNNLLMNPSIENILHELIELKQRGKLLYCESQSGFDGRILFEKPHLAGMIKQAGFRYPRIAWDGPYSEYPKIEKQLKLLINAGYKSQEISVFMLYNWNIPFNEMEQKRLKCWEWQVQIADCRYRPLNQLYDRYNFQKKQTPKDYYIHEEKGWTDALIKQFRKNVREQNICVRHRFPFYSHTLEKDLLGADVMKRIMERIKRLETIEEKIKLLEDLRVDYWIPNNVRYPIIETLSGATTRVQ